MTAVRATCAAAWLGCASDCSRAAPQPAAGPRLLRGAGGCPAAARPWRWTAGTRPLGPRRPPRPSHAAPPTWCPRLEGGVKRQGSKDPGVPASLGRTNPQHARASQHSGTHGGGSQQQHCARKTVGASHPGRWWAATPDAAAHRSLRRPGPPGAPRGGTWAGCAALRGPEWGEGGIGTSVGFGQWAAFVLCQAQCWSYPSMEGDRTYAADLSQTLKQKSSDSIFKCKKRQQRQWSKSNQQIKIKSTSEKSEMPKKIIFSKDFSQKITVFSAVIIEVQLVE